MTEFVIPAPPQPSVAIQNSTARFPVRRIFCVGRNYAEHAREFGNDPDKEPPFFFMKPADALIGDDETIPYPAATQDLHYEGEMVVALSSGGVNIPEAEALNCVWGYGAGNDLTRRDLQSEAKAMRRPWDMGKGFDRGAVCGALAPASVIGHPASGRIWSTVDGELRQDGDLADMIWSVPGQIAYLSTLVELKAGDLILTGTPAGVGALKPGQSCTVTVEGIGSVTTTIAG